MAFKPTLTPEERLARQAEFEAGLRQKHFGKAKQSLTVNGPFLYIEQYFQPNGGYHLYFFGIPADGATSRTASQCMNGGLDRALQYCRIEIADFQMVDLADWNAYRSFKQAASVTLKGEFTPNGLFTAVEWNLGAAETTH